MAGGFFTSSATWEAPYFQNLYEIYWSLVGIFVSDYLSALDRHIHTHIRRHKRRGFDPWVGKIPLEEGMAIHSSILAWRIQRTEEPGELHSIGSQRVRHNWSGLTYTQNKCRQKRSYESIASSLVCPLDFCLPLLAFSRYDVLCKVPHFTMLILLEWI